MLGEARIGMAGGAGLGKQVQMEVEICTVQNPPAHQPDTAMLWVEEKTKYPVSRHR